LHSISVAAFYIIPVFVDTIYVLSPGMMEQAGIYDANSEAIVVILADGFQTPLVNR
jgi:hypothetical protein